MNDLNKEKLEQLEQLCSDLKQEINEIFNETPHHPKLPDYEGLHAELGEIERIIKRIK